MKEIKVGSKVKYRPCFGMFEPKVATIKYMERSEIKRCKYGVEVDSIPFSEREYGVFILDDGHWCYGEQIDSIVSE